MDQAPGRRPSRPWILPGRRELAADAWGTPDHQPVLLLHGGGQTRHAWRGARPTLGRGGYRPSPSTCGAMATRAGRPTASTTTRRFVDDLAVAASLGRPPILVGASLGGIVSLLATGEDGRVEPPALVLVDIAHRSEREVQHPGVHVRPARGFASLDEVADAIAAYQPHRSRPTNLDGLARTSARGEDGRYHWHWDPRYFASRRDLSTEEEERRDGRRPPDRRAAGADPAGAGQSVRRAVRDRRPSSATWCPTPNT